MTRPLGLRMMYCALPLLTALIGCAGLAAGTAVLGAGVAVIVGVAVAVAEGEADDDGFGAQPAHAPAPARKTHARVILRAGHPRLFDTAVPRTW